MTEESDRRRGARIPVQMWVEERSAEGLYFQRACNLSPGGMFLEQTIPHPVGTVVTLEFTLPDGSGPLTVKAEIVNASGEDIGLGMGLKFIDVGAEAAARIDAYILSASQGGR